MPEFMKSRAVQVVFAVLVVAMVAGGALLVLRPDSTSAAPVAPVTPAASAEPPGSAPSAEPSPAPVDTAAPAAPSSTAPADTCTTSSDAMESPKRFVVERMGVDSPMMVVGKDADGDPGAPPPSQPYTTAWYNRSPAPGTDRGNVILTIHTYSKGQALGNQLYGKNGLADGAGGLRVGDLIKISDSAGNQVCYRYTGNTKVWVDTYDPASGVFHNPDGPAQLAIMICWDYAPATNEWDSRIIFYASLIPEGTPA